MMKASAFVLLFLFCYIECRKTYVPIDKNANLAFINMEGGGVRPGGNVQPPSPAQGSVPPSAPAKQPNAPQTPPPTPKPAAVAPPVAKPAQTPAPAPVPAKPAQPAQPAHPPSQIKPVPVNPAPVANPITTPGPGTVKQLVNFYDSQGKASPIRPYSYSSAVKQG